jgi:hypothetical protein
VADIVTPEWLTDVDWQRTYASGERRFRWGRLGEDYVGEWDACLVVRADAQGLVKAWAPHPAAGKALVEKLKYGEAAAFVRALCGRLSLHASAVALGRAATLVTGQSGAGKSTVAWQLCRAFGGALLADDVAAINSSGTLLRLEPSERLSWLDQGDGIKAAEAMRCGDEPTDLTLFVSLRFDEGLDGLTMRQIRGAEAVTHILQALLRFDPAPALWDQEFDVFARLFRDVPMLDVARPRRVPAAATAEAIFEQMRSQHQGSGERP